MDLIQPGDWVFLKLPSSNIKLVQLQKDSELIDLGKFGSFESKYLFGQYFGISLQINVDGTLSRYVKSAPTFDQNDNNNQHFTDDQSNQQLTQSDIEQMKLDNKSNIIDEIIKNNKQFTVKPRIK